MKKDVNFTLLKLLVFLMVAIAVTSVYYQYTYNTLRLDYDEASSTLEKTSEGLSEKEAVLQEREQELSTSIEREEGLTTKYVSEKTEKERIAGELDQTKQELSSLNKKYNTLQNDYENLQDDNAALKRETIALDATIESLKNDIDDLKDEIAALKAAQV